ncbi:hypothetical protein QJS10_CPB12g00628 [Acorus calamus]|uniref:Reverse transcriptase domain-containing protein n=1 Tax=Acorus calamus TaxID=4465 RepID=A0AAV9DNH1_ACOCL|nr:hypothetical protein QJS10_CPB12g00628 [Acorus calamus]
MKGDGSPGPDGFHVGFFQKCWETIKRDLIEAVQEFFHCGKLLGQLNTSFISLIPKCSNADSLDLFRPISLCGSVYKLITKILATRLQKMLSDLISPNQTAFIKGRKISHGILLVHEMVKYLAKKTGKARAAIKIDLRKAFDSIRWPFIQAVLESMNFSPRWIQWIMACIQSPRYSVLINGSPFGFFESYSGLRQGDPISPLLFVLVMEVLSQKLDVELTNGRIGLELNSGKSSTFCGGRNDLHQHFS